MSGNSQGTRYWQTMRMMNYNGLKSLTNGAYMEIPKALQNSSREKMTDFPAKNSEQAYCYIRS